jgi:hypothetical protein
MARRRVVRSDRPIIPLDTPSYPGGGSDRDSVEDVAMAGHVGSLFNPNRGVVKGRPLAIAQGPPRQWRMLWKVFLVAVD